ncbi:hypothetical protein JR311_09725 [Bacillus velezensis]|uniref:hypothetical protein n=1 Tax=Bacillus amyloliquefaciens group TaxID=1938374 RepID=UPI00195CEC93|nr:MULTISPECIES: hypothetical protein [Bacillus amyloliquefaciens group]MEB4594489.1 hypothetical protein [Bacillus amyloliquefaciens]QRV11169.1 hypothetical protein JR311_09725 [Bacillus velezensis]UTY67960.1 hypothetical protein NN913_08730 [Bacillus velezensis]
MKEYVDIQEIQYSDLKNYIREGWEVIDNYKIDEKYIYVVGYHYKQKVEDLKTLIKIYEDFGFKEQLFNAIAKINNDNYTKIKKYSSKNDSFYRNETTEFLNRYEKILGTKTKYGTEEDDTDSWGPLYKNDTELPF